MTRFIFVVILLIISGIIYSVKAGVGKITGGKAANFQDESKKVMQKASKGINWMNKQWEIAKAGSNNTNLSAENFFTMSATGVFDVLKEKQKIKKETEENLKIILELYNSTSQEEKNRLKMVFLDALKNDPLLYQKYIKHGLDEPSVNSEFYIFLYRFLIEVKRQATTREMGEEIFWLGNNFIAENGNKFYQALSNEGCSENVSSIVKMEFNWFVFSIFFIAQLSEMDRYNLDDVKRRKVAESFFEFYERKFAEHWSTSLIEAKELSSRLQLRLDAYTKAWNSDLARISEKPGWPSIVTLLTALISLIQASKNDTFETYDNKNTDFLKFFILSEGNVYSEQVIKTLALPYMNSAILVMAMVTEIFNLISIVNGQLEIR